MIKSIIKSLKITIALIACVIGFSNKANAQYDPTITQYMFNELYINPAFAGSKEALSMTALHRNQWVGIDGAPKTTTFSAHGPIMNQKMGIGISILNESIGVTKRNLVYANYAYRIPVGPGKLSFGIQAGIANSNQSYSKLTDPTNPNALTNVNDAQFSANVKFPIAPNFGFGMYYYAKRFYAGLSIPRMIDNSANVTNGTLTKINKFNLKGFHYYAVAGYLIDQVSPDVKIKPQVMINVVQGAPIQFDLNVMTLTKEKLWLGVAYRSGSDISGIVGYQINPQFLINYAYDWSRTRRLSTYNKGSHEISLNYLFSYRGKKIQSPRYF